jgi:hypothetical protein
MAPAWANRFFCQRQIACKMLIYIGFLMQPDSVSVRRDARVVLDNVWSRGM